MTLVRWRDPVRVGEDTKGKGLLGSEFVTNLACVINSPANPLPLDIP